MANTPRPADVMPRHAKGLGQADTNPRAIFLRLPTNGDMNSLKVAEMNKKKKKMGELTRSSLLDAAANSEDAAAMEESLKLARKNGVLGRYAAEMDVLNPLPGDARRRQALLGALPALPSDNRESEAAAAVSFLAVVVGSLLLRLFDPENGAANGALVSYEQNPVTLVHCCYRQYYSSRSRTPTSQTIAGSQ